MIIPVGPENTTLNRHPLVTYVLMGFLVVVFFLVTFFAQEDLGAMKQACTYRFIHPYLEGTERFEEIYGQIGFWLPREQYEEPPGKTELERRRQKMLTLSEQGLEELDNRFEARFGIMPQDPTPYGLLTYMFINPGAIALLMNLLFLYMTAPYIEDRWGRPFFAGMFIIGGIFSGVGLIVTYPDSFRSLIGSSGAVATIAGAYMVRYPFNRIRFEIFSVIPMKDSLYVHPFLLYPVWYLFNFGVQYWLYEKQNEGFGPGYVPYVINLYGFAFGAIVAGVIRIFKLELLIYKTPFEKMPLILQYRSKIEEALLANETEKAWSLMMTAIEAFPEDFELQAMVWDQAVRMRREESVAGIAQSYIDTLTKEGNYQRAYFCWQEMNEALPGRRVPLNTIHDLVNGLLSVELKNEARDVMRVTFQQQGETADSRVLITMVQTASFVDPALSSQAIEIMGRRKDLDQPTLMTLRELDRENQLLGVHVSDENEIVPSQDTIALVTEDPFSPTKIQALRRIEGIPLSLEQAGLQVALRDKRKVPVSFGRIRGLTIAAIRPLGGKPYLLLDILADHPYEEKEKHDLMRFDTRHFDPRRICPDESPANAMRQFVDLLLVRSEAIPIPDAARVQGDRFPSYPSVEDFESTVYGV